MLFFNLFNSQISFIYLFLLTVTKHAKLLKKLFYIIFSFNSAL